MVQAGARFVPNRSADIGTGAEPAQRRGWVERCELGQLALVRPSRFIAGEQVRKEQRTLQEESTGGWKTTSGADPSSPGAAPCLR
jgi:hypothetical protein